jgi:hypothetical protein
MFFLLPFLFLFNLEASSVDALHPKWLKLLHYRQTLFGNWKSEADGKDFFIHPEGRTNPQAELASAIASFGQTKSPNNDHPICKFPLRFKWLNHELGFPWKDVNLMGCEKYISFFSKMAAKKAHIVFSSYYLSNPNSAFGHTLLRLSRFEAEGETELLDYGINFAADANTPNPLTYALYGLTGGFKGHFTAIPYYYKIREYSDAEFRDLWSYELDLTQAQVLELVDHVWELGSTYFDYFYFQENCSYHLLGLLDVVLENKRLTDHFRLFTIPADTIRVLKKEGLIKKGKRRPSTYSRLLAESEKLSSKERALAKDLALNPEKVAALDPEKPKNADILDTSISAFDYFNSQSILTDHAPTMERKSSLLRARAINPTITDEVKVSEGMISSPALIHAPTRYTLTEGYQHSRGKFTRFEIRLALHDLLDPPEGALERGELEMFKLSGSFREKDYQSAFWRFDEFTLVNLKNYPLQNTWASHLTWEIGLGLRQDRDLHCFDCPGGDIQGSVGNTVSLGEKAFVAILLNTNLFLHNRFQENYRLGLGPKITGRVEFSKAWAMRIDAFYHWNTYSRSDSFTDQLLVIEGETRYHLNSSLSLLLKGGVQKFDHANSRAIAAETGLQYFY